MLMSQDFSSGPCLTPHMYSQGRKLVEERDLKKESVLFCCSLTGEKREPFVIGKSHHPHFRGIKNLPTRHQGVRSAWMTASLFEEWLKGWDQELRKGKKALLTIDNCPAHPLVESMGLSNLKVVFLPPNMTAVLQPLDQGIIHTFKARYRKEICQRILTELDGEASTSATDLSKKITLLDSLALLSQAWKEVSTTSIRNCWRKGGPCQTETEKEDSVLPPQGFTMESFDEWCV